MLPTLSWRGTLATAAAVTASAFAGATTATAAAACGSADNGEYFASGFGPCTIGELTFSNFSFDPGNSGYRPEWTYFQPFGGRLVVGADLSVFSPTFLSVTFTVAAAAGREIVGMDTRASILTFGSNFVGTGSFRATGSNGAVADAAATNEPRQDRERPRPTATISFDGVDSLTVTTRLFAEKVILFSGDIGFTVADKPAVTPVPEPASLALFGIGLTGLAALRARRRARAGSTVH